MKSKLKFTQQDLDETDWLAKVLREIDNIDAEYVNAVTDEIYKIQPYFLTVLLGYSYDVSGEELEEIMKIYFIIWEYFRLKPNIKKMKVTETFFDQIQAKNIGMLKYSEGEADKTEKIKIYAGDIQKLKSKSLWTAILFRYNNRIVISKMNSETRAAVLIGIKCFIECFEKI